MIGANEQPNSIAGHIHNADSWRDVGTGGTFLGDGWMTTGEVARVDVEDIVDNRRVDHRSGGDGGCLSGDPQAAMIDPHPVAHPVAHASVPHVAHDPKRARATIHTPSKSARKAIHKRPKKAGKVVAHSVAQGPVPPDVPLVAHDTCATSGTQPANPRKPKSYGKRRDKCATPKNVPGHEWRNLDSGWALFSRTPTISEAGKRSSTRKYLRWYTQAAIERIYGNGK